MLKRIFPPSDNKRQRRFPPSGNNLQHIFPPSDNNLQHIFPPSGNNRKRRFHHSDNNYATKKSRVDSLSQDDERFLQVIILVLKVMGCDRGTLLCATRTNTIVRSCIIDNLPNNWKTSGKFPQALWCVRTLEWVPMKTKQMGLKHLAELVKQGKTSRGGTNPKSRYSEFVCACGLKCDTSKQVGNHQKHSATIAECRQYIADFKSTCSVDSRQKQQCEKCGAKKPNDGVAYKDWVRQHIECYERWKCPLCPYYGQVLCNFRAHLRNNKGCKLARRHPERYDSPPPTGP
jgi:hypothetical protein